jgi:hypothetical protein
MSEKGAYIMQYVCETVMRTKYGAYLVEWTCTGSVWVLCGMTEMERVFGKVVVRERRDWLRIWDDRCDRVQP